MKDKLLTLGGFDRAKAWINVALQAIQTRIAGILPSQTGNSGKILKTDGTDASWAPLGSAIPTLTSPVSIWDLDAGLYFVQDGCEIYYRNSSSTSSVTTVHKASMLTVCVDDSGGSTVKRWYCWCYVPGSYLEQLLSGWTNGSNDYQFLVSSFWQRESSNSADYDIGVRDYYAVSNFNSLAFSQANGWGVGYMTQNCSNKPASLTLTEDTYFVLIAKNSFSTHSYINYNYNAIRQDLYVPVHNKHYYRIVKYHNSTITPNTSIANADSYGWVEVLDTLPSISNNAGKVLAVNSNADGLEWVNQSGGGGGLSNYDFTHVNPTVSGSTATITFSANQRGSAMMGVSSDIGLTIACNNGSDNYIWVKNIGSAEIDVTINAVTKNGTAVSYVYVPSDGITVPAGGVCEIGVIVNSDGAFITSRNDLAL